MAVMYPLASRLECESNVQDVALHPTHRLLASALASGSLLLHIYDPLTEGTAGSLQIWQAHALRPFSGTPQPDCTAVCFVGAGEGGETVASVATGSPTGSLWAADCESGSELWAQGAAHASRIKVAVPLGQHRLATGDSRGGVKIWDLRMPGPAANLELPEGGVADLCLVPGQDALLAASSGGVEGSLSTISLRQRQVLSSCQQFCTLHAVATLHSGRTVVCGSELGRWGVGRFGSLKDMAFRSGHGQDSVSSLVSCDDTGIISASSDGSIRASRIEDSPVEVLPRPAVQAHASGSRVRVALSGSGSFLASAAVGEAAVQLWHAPLLFAGHQQRGTLPKLTLRRDNTAAAAAAAEAAAEAQARQQQPASSGVHEKPVCIICMDAEATGGFAHAGTMHSGFCAACIRGEQRQRPGVCPACRGKVDAYIERTF